MGSGVVLTRAQEKYGIDNFRKEILEVFDNPEDMFNMESTLVNEEFIKRDDVYNIKLGGYGGFDYINFNIPFENRGFNFINKNQLNNIAGQCYIAAKKIKSSPEYSKWFSKKVSQGLIQYYKNGGDASYGFKNKTHSEETKKKMSLSHKGKHDGEKNSQFGSMWIYNSELKESKKIPKGDKIPDGWLKGRKIRF